jgi:hypothetical protein
VPSSAWTSELTREFGLTLILICVSGMGSGRTPVG